MRTIEQVHRMVDDMDKIASLLEKHDVMTQADILKNLLAAWIIDHVDQDQQEEVLGAHIQGVRIRIAEFKEDEQT
jgi:hypothetical protein